MRRMPTKKDPYKGMSKKQINFVDKYLECRDSSKAALFAFDTSEANASRVGYNYMQRDKIKLSLKFILEGKISKNRARIVLEDGLKATYTNKDGAKIPDYNARLGYLKEYYKLMGMYKPEKKDIKKVVIDEKKALEELEEYANKE